MEIHTLENLFRLSNFHFDELTANQWQHDLNQWLTFFALPDHSSTPPHPYHFASTTTVDQLRQDEQSSTSLTSAEIKLFSKRFVDGFVALPEHQSRTQ